MRKTTSVAAAGCRSAIESAAASEIAPRIPHQPTTTRSRSAEPGRQRQQREDRPARRSPAPRARRRARSAARRRSVADLVDDRLELQPEQDEQHRLQPEGQDLPERGRGQARVGVEVLRLVPAAVDAARRRRRGCPRRRSPRPRCSSRTPRPSVSSDRDGHVGLARGSPAGCTQPTATPTSAPPTAASMNSSSRVAAARTSPRRPPPSATRNAGQARGVVDQRLALDQPPHAVGHAHAGERRDRRDRVRRRDRGAEHERGRPRQPVDQPVRGDRDHGSSSRARAPARAGPSARLSARSSRGDEYQPAHMQQRRDEDEQHDVRVELHARHARDERQRRARRARARSDTGMRDAVGGPHEQHGARTAARRGARGRPLAPGV